MTNSGKSRLDSILESVDAAIITIYTTGNIMDIISVTSRLFGYKENELVGQNVKMLTRPMVGCTPGITSAIPLPLLKKVLRWINTTTVA